MKPDNYMPAEIDFDKSKDQRFSPSVHSKLKAAKVAVAGLGGIGSHTAVMLARSGVGHLGIIDFDFVDISNLNRQAYTVRDIGIPKTDALERILKEINPYIHVEKKQIKIDPENTSMLLSEYPIVCEAFDAPEEKASLVNAVLERCPASVCIAVSGMAGYGDANLVKSRRVMKRLFVCGDETSDAYSGIGLMAPRVLVCAGHQANLVIQQILNTDKY